MKESELRKHAVCSLCNQKIGHTGLPMFWRVKIERFALNAEALKRQQGLAMMLGGNAAIAGAMGPDEDMATLFDEVTLTVCETCAIEKDLPIAALAEKKE